MTDRFHFIEEPKLVFADGQRAQDPHDGLALFGAVDQRSGLPSHAVIGTQRGLELWNNWCETLNQSAACEDPSRHRPWPPYPGFEVAFGSAWPTPARAYGLDPDALERDASLADRNARTYAVTNHYLKFAKDMAKLDEKPSVVICVVPDVVHRNCRSQTWVSDPSDTPKSADERRLLWRVLKDRKTGQARMFPETDPFSTDDPILEQYDFSPDFRRQLKARMMDHELPVQIVKEATLDITDNIRRGVPGSNPLSDRLWNFSTGIFYKLGRKPWKLDTAREGVCYIGLAYKQAGAGRTACCAAQLFLDSGDGLVFVGDFGPWYSEEKKEFHLTRSAAREMLAGTLETYARQGGPKLREIFIHARSGLNSEEFMGFQEACPSGVNLVGIRVRKDRLGIRLFRHDSHPQVARRGMYPVVRGAFWQRGDREGFLFATGFKERIAAYDGWELPVPLSLTLQHGDAEMINVAKDILTLSKANYNACQLGESEPITIKYSDRVGEILLSNPELPREQWQHNFKYYI